MSHLRGSLGSQTFEGPALIVMRPALLAACTTGRWAPPRYGYTASAPLSIAVCSAAVALAVLSKSYGKSPVGTYVMVYDGSTAWRPSWNAMYACFSNPRSQQPMKTTE